MKTHKYIRLISDNWILEIAVSNDLSPYRKGENLHNYGSITLVDKEDEIFWDNIDAFIIFSDKLKRKCKKQLIKTGFYKKGILKELEELIDEAIELKLIG